MNDIKGIIFGYVLKDRLIDQNIFIVMVTTKLWNMTDLAHFYEKFYLILYKTPKKVKGNTKIKFNHKEGSWFVELF